VEADMLAQAANVRNQLTTFQTSSASTFAQMQQSVETAAVEQQSQLESMQAVVTDMQTVHLEQFQSLLQTLFQTRQQLDGEMDHVTASARQQETELAAMMSTFVDSFSDLLESINSDIEQLKVEVCCVSWLLFQISLHLFIILMQILFGYVSQSNETLDVLSTEASRFHRTLETLSAQQAQSVKDIVSGANQLVNKQHEIETELEASIRRESYDGLRFCNS
jgi:hypothetical protein